MATYNKFNAFVMHLCQGVHDLRAAGDTLNIYLTNGAPSAADDVVKADLAGISEEHGYTPDDAANDLTESGATETLVCTDIIFTAAGGTFGPLRYAVLYNDTPATPGNLVTDPLIAWWDYGTNVTVLEGETFTVDFASVVFTLT